MSDWEYPGEGIRLERNEKPILKQIVKEYRSEGISDIEPPTVEYKQRINIYT